ncbi:hypothetical protein Tco_1465697 [Tanacetum coccineum]
MIRVKLMVCMYYYFTVDSCSSAHEQNQDEANEVRAERMVTTINLLAIVATTMTQSPIPSNESQSSSRSKTKARDVHEALSDIKVDNGPSYDTNGLTKVKFIENVDYNMFAHERRHPEQLESIHDTYVMEHDDSDDLSASRDMDQSRGEDKYDDVCHEQGCSLIATLV